MVAVLDMETPFTGQTCTVTYSPVIAEAKTQWAVAIVLL